MLPDPMKFHFAEDGQLVYGNYGGANYSAGHTGGTLTFTAADPAPVDAYDLLYYQHDAWYQIFSDPAHRLEADARLAHGIYDLLF